MQITTKVVQNGERAAMMKKTVGWAAGVKIQVPSLISYVT